MGFMDKLKDAGKDLAGEAKRASVQAQDKANEVNARRKADAAAKKLGYLIYREKTQGHPQAPRSRPSSPRSPRRRVRSTRTSQMARVPGRLPPPPQRYRLQARPPGSRARTPSSPAGRHRGHGRCGRRGASDQAGREVTAAQPARRTGSTQLLRLLRDGQLLAYLDRGRSAMPLTSTR